MVEGSSSSRAPTISIPQQVTRSIEIENDNARWSFDRDRLNGLARLPPRRDRQVRGVSFGIVGSV